MLTVNVEHYNYLVCILKVNCNGNPTVWIKAKRTELLYVKDGLSG